MMLSGCSDRDAMREMDRADAVIDECPDSALGILSSIDPATLHTSKGKSRHSLLLGLAKFKMGEDSIFDSTLVATLKDYISKKGETREIMLAYFLYANASHLKGSDSIAENAFKNLYEVSKKTGDDNYPGIALSSLGGIAASNGETEHAIKYYEEAINYLSTRSSLPKYIIFSHLAIADEYGVAENFDKMKVHLDMAESLSAYHKIDAFKGRIEETRGVLNFYKGDFNEACYNFEKAGAYGRDLSYRNMTYWATGAYGASRDYATDLHDSVSGIKPLTATQNICRLVMERNIASILRDPALSSAYSDSVIMKMDEIASSESPRIHANDSGRIIAGDDESQTSDLMFKIIGAATFILLLAAIIYFAITGRNSIRKTRLADATDNAAEMINPMESSPREGDKSVKEDDRKELPPHAVKEEMRDQMDEEGDKETDERGKGCTNIDILVNKYSGMKCELKKHSESKSKEGEIMIRKIRRTASSKRFMQEMRHDVDNYGGNLYSRLIQDNSLNEDEEHLLLYSLCGFGYREIAMMTGDLPATVSSRLSRLKKRIEWNDVISSAAYISHMEKLKVYCYALS